MNETFVRFSESEQGHFIGAWTVESAPTEFLRALAAEAIRTGETVQARDGEGCLVTASIQADLRDLFWDRDESGEFLPNK